MAKLGDFNTQKIHIQHFGKADFKDIAWREDINRNRKINATLGVLGGFGLGYTVLSLRFGFNELAIWTGIIGFVLLMFLLIRVGFLKKRSFKSNLRKNNFSWQKIRKVPSWVSKKVKKFRTRHVNGEYYIYKKDGKNYYRKKK